MRVALALPCCLAALAVCIAFAPPASADTGIRLNEIMAGPARDWDGSGTFSSRDDEWVEITNTSAAPIDLGSFMLTDGDSIPRYVFSGMLDPGDHRIVFGVDSWNWEKATGHPAFGLSLANSGDAVMLWHIAAGETLLVDSYKFLSHEAAADRAIGRLPDGTGDWVLFDSLDPYTGTLLPAGTGCAPSPGQPNQCSTTPTTRVTWGQVKSRYH
jgi:hypothetical protein